MKILSGILLSFIFISQSHAGLFEYTQGENTHINSTLQESADIIESLNMPTPNYSYSLESYNNYSYPQAWYRSNVQPTIFADDYYGYNNYNTSSYNYYDNDSIIKEMQYYVSIANGIRTDISKMRKYGSEYDILRNQLKRDLSDLERQVTYLSNLRKSIAQRNIKYSSYSLYRSPTRSQRLADYYRKYGYEYRDSSYYYYDTSYNYYQRKPKWLNENLRPREEGYIYIQ